MGVRNNTHFFLFKNVHCIVTIITFVRYINVLTH